MFFFSEYLKQNYGKSLYRVPIDLPLSCPNRVNNGGKGCIYCPDDGSRARHLRANLDLGHQVREGIEYIRKRYSGTDIGYIAYFQSFTNTFGSVELLREYYYTVLNSFKFDMVIISTRPDCLSDEILEFLEELSCEYDLWIELGVQTVHERTLTLINRQHGFSCVEKSVKALAERNIKCAAHVILGLPGENLEDYIETARVLSVLPFSGIKIHNLLILKNTPLGHLYQKQIEGGSPGFPVIRPLNEYEYADILIKFIEHIPESWPLMRITADAPEKDVIAPKWWMKKGQFLEYVKRRVLSGENGIGGMPEVLTEDGSVTLYHPEYRQHFHSLTGAATEALEKFIKPSGIESMLKDGKRIRVLDVGFGLGVNALSLIEIAEKDDISGYLEIISLEKDIRTLEAAAALNPELEILKSCKEHLSWEGKRSDIIIKIGDAVETVCDISEKFDALFLDAFSPDVNPELWTYDFIKKITAMLKPDGVILTYSSAFPVLGAFKRCGLYIGEVKSENRHRAGIICSFEGDRIINSLSEKKNNIILHSTAGVAYRNPGGCCCKEEIFTRRAALVKKLQKKGIPKWYKTP